MEYERKTDIPVRTDLFVDLLQKYPKLLDTSMLTDRVNKKREAMEGFQKEFYDLRGIQMSQKQVYKKLQNIFLKIQSKLKRTDGKVHFQDYELIFMRLKEEMNGDKFRM